MKPSEPSRQFKTCLELAQEGERLCKLNRIKQGIEYLEQSLKVGTEDLKTLSAIYSQLGNAYFSLREYDKSVNYHSFDLIIARELKDLAGVAKACGNVGNAFKLQGSFNDALTFTNEQLKLARQLNDKACEARALYNLASIYLMKGKRTGRMLKSVAAGDTTLFSANSETPLPYLDDINNASNCYIESLKISEEIGDKIGCGRTYGCLGNTYYLLRDYRQAVQYHQKRLEVAREFGDKHAQRRAYTNLGNAHIFLSEIDKAIEYYRLAFSLAVDLKDRHAEAQSCFSLANAAALISDFETATNYHTSHLAIARLLNDRAGEARAYSSLANDYRNCGDLPKAAYFLCRNRLLARELNDSNMMNQAEDTLRLLLEEDPDALSLDDKELRLDSSGDPEDPPLSLRMSLSLRSLNDFSEDDCGLLRQPVFHSDGDVSMTSQSKSARSVAQGPEEDLLDLISRMQSKRMDEQRCDASILSDLTNKKEPRHSDNLVPSPSVSRKSSSRRVSFIGRVKSSVFQPFQPGATSTPLTKMKRAVSRPSEFFRTSSFSRFGSLRSKKGSSETSSSVNLSGISHAEDAFNDSHFAVPVVPTSTKKNDSRRLSLCEKKMEELKEKEESTAKEEQKEKKMNGPEALIDLLMAAQGSGRRMDEQRATLLPGLNQGGQAILDKLHGDPELEKGSEIDDHLLELLVRAQSQRMNEQRSELGGRSSNSIADEEKPRPPTIPEGEDEISALVREMQSGSSRLVEEKLPAVSE